MLPEIEKTDKKELYYDSTLSDMRHCHSWLGRLIAKWLRKNIDKSVDDGKLNLNFLFNYNMPFRAMSKMTGGMLDSQMVYDIIFIMNGHFWRGTGRLIRDYFKNRKNIKQATWYHPELNNSKEN